jgi:hypothetical protein
VASPAGRGYAEQPRHATALPFPQQERRHARPDIPLTAVRRPCPLLQEASELGLGRPSLGEVAQRHPPGRRVYLGRQGVRERAEQRGAEAAGISGQLAPALLAHGLGRATLLRAQRVELLLSLALPTAGRTRGGDCRSSLGSEHWFDSVAALLASSTLGAPSVLAHRHCSACHPT